MEKRLYSREELAHLTGARLSDEKHFKRNAENALIKWGYGYDWLRGGAVITHVPSTPKERLKEILIRQFHIDIQVDMYAFACFVTAFTDVPGFDCMPWKVREAEFEKYSGHYYSSRTLSSWARKLIEQDIMYKGAIGSFWKTSVKPNGEKVRTSVTYEEVKEYFDRRSELIEKYATQILENDVKKTYEAARRSAWQIAFEILWDQYQCCYYSCKTFQFSAWND